VYDTEAPAADAVAGPSVAEPPALAGTKMPTPVNALPLPLPGFKDPRVAFGVNRCYVVRAVRLAGAISIESPSSAPVCLSFIDTFPPAAPQSLVSVANEGAISLIWEPNTEKDLAGYLVLRGEAPGETLTALTLAPIHETTYRDTTAKPGVTYVYGVVAVDSAPQPNTSAYSNRVTEVAR
jgi:fibronectin type 3 domain-containing protein